MPSAPAKTKSIHELITLVEQRQRKADLPEIRPGDTVAVHAKIVERGKVRTQLFEGVVLKYVRRAGLGACVTVRKIASGIGVERTFFLHSPLIKKIEVKKHAKVRRARLYHLRALTA